MSKETQLTQLPISQRQIKAISDRISQLGPDRLNEKGTSISEIHFLNPFQGRYYKGVAKWDGREWIIWITNEYAV